MQDWALSPAVWILTPAWPTVSFHTLRLNSQGPLFVVLRKLRPRDFESETQHCYLLTLTSVPPTLSSPGIPQTRNSLPQDCPPSWIVLFLM